MYIINKKEGAIIKKLIAENEPGVLFTTVKDRRFKKNNIRVIGTELRGDVEGIKAYGWMQSIIAWYYSKKVNRKWNRYQKRLQRARFFARLREENKHLQK